MWIGERGSPQGASSLLERRRKLASPARESSIHADEKAVAVVGKGGRKSEYGGQGGHSASTESKRGARYTKDVPERIPQRKRGQGKRRRAVGRGPIFGGKGKRKSGR